MMITLEISWNFDPVFWQTCKPAGTGSVLLLTWRVKPEPVDGGIPEPVAGIIAEALLAVGVVAYGGNAGERIVNAMTVDVRRGFRRLKLILNQAARPEDVLPAFSNGVFDWSQNSQWLIVTKPSVSREELVDTARAVYGDWILPEPWPDGVRLIVQSVVDGDGAACFTIDGAVEKQFITALAASARSMGVQIVMAARPAT